MNILMFATHFYVQNNNLKKRQNEVIVRTYPSYSSNPQVIRVQKLAGFSTRILAQFLIVGVQNQPSCFCAI